MFNNFGGILSNCKNMLNAALLFAKNELLIFPCNKDKKPLVKWKSAATSDKEQIQKWLEQYPYAMIGLPTGKINGFFVVDIDCHHEESNGYKFLEKLIKENGELPKTSSVSTPSGGKHLYFRYPKDGRIIKNSAGKIALGIDVRGDGGYVIAPPSRNQDGQYCVCDDVPMADAPEWLLDKIVDSSKGGPSAKAENPCSDIEHDLHPYVQKALENNINDIATATEGTRNETLFKKVAALAGFIPSGDIEENMLKQKAEEAFRQCHPNDYSGSEFEATFAKAVTAGKKTPRGVPPKGFRLVDYGQGEGLWYDAPVKQGIATKAIYVGAPLYVLGMFRDQDKGNWGRLLEWKDPDGMKHRYPLSNEMLAVADASPWKAKLASEGYRFGTPSYKGDLLKKYLQESMPKRRLTCVMRTGWHDGHFVLPEITIPENGSLILLNPPRINPYAQNGSLEGWKEGVGAYAVGNTRILFALCVAFAGPLLELAGDESGGFNYVGASSTGKTTALLAAASVWGKGTPSGGYVRTWRSTDNALEGLAAIHNDTVLCLDELSQVQPKALEQAAYMLGNGQGKARADRRGEGRAIQNWRVLFFSTGEVGIKARLEEDGRSWKAGQAVRLLDIPADAGQGMGLFEDLHGFGGAAEFSDALRKSAAADYGHAGPAFVEKLCSLQAGSNLREELRSLSEKLCPSEADGQVRRAAARFALCWLAGSIASKNGIIPATPEQVEHAVRACFEAWREDRGTDGPLEEQAVIERTLDFICTNKARFENLDPRPFQASAIHFSRAGFFSETMLKSSDVKCCIEYTDYYIFSEVFKREICQGISHKTVAKYLKKAGYLIADNDGHLQKKLPSMAKAGSIRCYNIRIYEKQEKD